MTKLRGRADLCGDPGVRIHHDGGDSGDKAGEQNEGWDEYQLPAQGLGATLR
ncbi:MAG: hypothetical protein JO110_12030 [Acetobacteraceae bacterium]|nr:hypothetical protein [Acetobacteraceae bacterium]